MAKWVASPDFVQPTLHTLYNFVIECCRRSVTKLFAIFLLALVTLRRRATVGRLSIGKEIVGARVPPMFVHVSASRGRFLQNPTDTTRERPSLRHTTTLSSWIETLPYAQPPPPDQPASRSRLRPPPNPHPRLCLPPAPPPRRAPATPAASPAAPPAARPVGRERDATTRTDHPYGEDSLAACHPVEDVSVLKLALRWARNVG